MHIMDPAIALLTCFPGYIGFGDDHGSWFIHELCQVLLEQYGERDLESMLTEVNHRVTKYTTKIPRDKDDKRKSVPWVASMLTKQVRF